MLSFPKGPTEASNRSCHYLCALLKTVIGQVGTTPHKPRGGLILTRSYFEYLIIYWSLFHYNVMKNRNASKKSKKNAKRSLDEKNNYCESSECRNLVTRRGFSLSFLRRDEDNLRSSFVNSRQDRQPVLNTRWKSEHAGTLVPWGARSWTTSHQDVALIYPTYIWRVRDNAKYMNLPDSITLSQRSSMGIDSHNSGLCSTRCCGP